MLEQPNTKPNAILLVSVAVGAMMAYFVASTGVKAIFGTRGANASISETLAEAAENANRDLPMMRNEFTRIESATALPEGKILFKYTILNTDQLPNSSQLIAEVRPKAAEYYRTSREMADLRKVKATLVDSYSDVSGNELARFEVGPEDWE